jgi:hypothetical protein
MLRGSRSVWGLSGGSANPAKNQLLEEGIWWCEVRKRERRGYFGWMGTNEEMRRCYVPGARVTGQKSTRPDSPATKGGQSGLKNVSV